MLVSVTLLLTVGVIASKSQLSCRYSTFTLRMSQVEKSQTKAFHTLKLFELRKGTFAEERQALVGCSKMLV